METTTPIESERHGRVLVLTLDNPAARNALGPATYGAARKAFAEAARDPEVGAVVLTGAGGVFCAGGDLNRLGGNRHRPPEVQRQATEGLAAVIAAIRDCPRPVVAAVEGAAAGAGFSLVLACDLVVAAEDAVFAMGYARVGLSPDGGASHALARALPRQLATEILLGGERIAPARLHHFGLVNRVVASGQALAEALQWAAKLAEGPPEAMARTKRLLEQALDTPLAGQLAAETDAFVDTVHGAEAGIGIAAFLARSKPDYRGGDGG